MLADLLSIDWRRLDKTKQDGKPYHLYPTPSYRCCPYAAISIAMRFTGLTRAMKALTGLLSYTISILLISSLSSENFRKIQKTFLIEIQSQKEPGLFLPTPYRRGYRLSRKLSRLRRLGFTPRGFLPFCLCIS